MTELRLNPEQAQKIFFKLMISYLSYDGPIFHKQRKPEVSK